MTKKITIHDAITMVLKDHETGMTLNEIIEQIQSRNLYAFKVANPRGVVRNAIRRHSSGTTDLDRANVQNFELVKNGTVILIKTH